MNSRKKKFVISQEMYASHKERLANYVIDYLIQIVLFFFVALAISIVGVITKNNLLVFWVSTLTLFQQYFFGLIIMLLYYNFFEIVFGITIGKLITGTVVVDENGEKPTSQSILTRTLCRAIPFEALSFLGVVSHGWHDTLSTTYVVKKAILEQEKKYILEQTSNKLAE